MDDILKNLKVPRLFAEVLKGVVGLNLLLFIGLYYQFPINSIPNFNELGDTLKALVFLSVSYALGRILLIIGDFLIDMIELLFHKERFNKFVVFCSDVCHVARHDSIPIPEKKHIGYELDEFIESHQNLRDQRDRDFFSKTFLRLLIGASTLLIPILFESKFWAIPFTLTTFFVFIDFSTRARQLRKRGEIASYFKFQSNIKKP